MKKLLALVLAAGILSSSVYVDAMVATPANSNYFSSYFNGPGVTLPTPSDIITLSQAYPLVTIGTIAAILLIADSCQSKTRWAYRGLKGLYTSAKTRLFKHEETKK